nr:MAG TPA: zinc-ribbon domain protein [Caudoviricetes sp.]
MNYTCNKCGKSMDEINFYTYKNGKKTELCKKCLTMHINNFEPNTFLWALEKMDVPYVPEEWNILRDKAYAKDPYKMNGMSVFGKYLSKMRLKQWKDYSWADTEKIAQEKEKKTQKDLEQQKKFEESMKQQLEKGEISEAEYKTMVSTPTQNAELAVKAPKNEIGTDNFYDENNFISEDELIDPAAELTQEDKIYLAMKWGRLYKPNEWVELEKKYEEMTSSFDIQDSDTTGTLILICKTYLKMNQAIDCGDMDGYQKLSRVYDSLRKSAKFTAAQNKEVKSDFVDCIGEMVAYCEKNGGQIPRMKIDAPNDIVDKVIMDLKEYTRSLIYDDKSLAQQIENYIKQRENADAMKKDREEAKEKGYNQIEIKDRDYQAYFENIAKEKEEDEKIYIGEDEDFI